MKLLITSLLLIPILSWGSEQKARELYVKAKTNFLQNGCDFEGISDELFNLVSNYETEEITKDSLISNLSMFLDCAYFYRDNTLPSYQQIIDKYPGTEVAYTLVSSDEYVSEKLLSSIINLLEKSQKTIDEKNKKDKDAIAILFKEKDLINNITINSGTLSKTYIVHFFASWDKNSPLDIPILLQAKELGIDIIGVVFRDDDFEMGTIEWNKYGGNPYKYIIKDKGLIAYEFKIIAVPETFIISNDIILENFKILNESFLDNFSYLAKSISTKDLIGKYQKELNTEPITEEEINTLKTQLHSCLKLNTPSPDSLYGINPTINIKVKPNKEVLSAKIINTEGLNNPSFRTAAEASMRAIYNPDCNPLKLPDGKYDQWKEINFTFDFSWIYD